MAGSGVITVDTGGAGADLSAFIRDAGLARAAVDSMKDGMRALNDAIAGAARGLARMGDNAKGVLAALMHTASVAQGLEGGIQNLYRYSRQWWRSFADSLDSLATNALYLKNSLGAMAAPLMQALSPAIDYVTDQFVGLFNLINQVFARLTGSGTYVAAKKTGQAWDAVSGRITKATAALKRYIMGFDQLNILGDSTSGDDGSSGGGGGGGGGGVMFEERQIDSGLADFVDSLKAAFQAADWQTLGTLLGEKLNELMDGVDWSGLGSKLGFYLNGAIQTAYYLLDSVNFTNIGKHIAEFLNSALEEIDFGVAGAAVALFFTSLAETLAGFIEEFDWTGFAGKLADGVNGFVGELGARLDAIDWAALALRLTEGLNAFIAGTDWALVGGTFGGRVNDLLAILGTAAASFDWSGAGKALADGVNGLFRTVDWETLGRWLNDTLQGVLDFGIAFVEGFDAQGFAEGIGKALAQVDWDALAEKLWTLFGEALKKLGQGLGTLLLGGDTDLKVNLSLLRKGWSTLTAWLGIDDPLSALIALGRSGWTTIAGFVGTAVTTLISLSKNGWSSIAGFVGTAVTAAISLSRNGWSSISGFVGTAVTTAISLSRDGWTSIGGFIGTAITVAAKLKNEDSSKYTPAKLFGTALTVESKLKNADKDKYTPAKIFGTSITVSATLAAASGTLDKLKKAVQAALSKIKVGVTKKALGGAITDGGRQVAFASGGVIRGGLARYLETVPHYAAGTSKAHGTVFVAGEAGPEIMGHINGRTEILNKSQLASAIYAAVVAGMAQAVNALGAFLGSRMTECANAIVATLANVAGPGMAPGVDFHMPAVAAGAVLPYEVAAQVARTGADLQDTLDANNEDLIQTLISVVGSQTAAILSALQAIQRQGDRGYAGPTSQGIINEINRRTQMFGASPLQGV